MKKQKGSVPVAGAVILVLIIFMGASLWLSATANKPNKKQAEPLQEIVGPYKEEIEKMKREYPERLTPLINKCLVDGKISKMEFESIQRAYSELRLK